MNIVLVNVQHSRKTVGGYLAERTGEPDSTTVVASFAVALVSRSRVTNDVTRDVIELGPAMTASLETEHSARLSAATASRRALRQNKQQQLSSCRWDVRPWRS